MRILFDQGTPVPLRRSLSGHDVAAGAHHHQLAQDSPGDRSHRGHDCLDRNWRLRGTVDPLNHQRCSSQRSNDRTMIMPMPMFQIRERR
jgi:hypothetical protein